MELENDLLDFLSIDDRCSDKRVKASKILCTIVFEHSESIKILISTGNLTSATGLVRLQYEALVRAIWLLYAASDIAVDKLMTELTNESAKKANNLPMLSEMLTKLEGKAPEVAMDALNEFKQYSWKALSSYVHGGIHAISRHSKGYPVEQLIQLLKTSNGLLIMAGMLLVILSGNTNQKNKIPSIQMKFKDCLPDQK
ncbi:hypothetical protein [Colwellia sp. M166]|uniref:DUF6988 family protein n=1 Tax=Colwellia sp. M166 TaxID=2583805 RepID=UPI00211EFF53|nr:hypothetical protein [Colwellia sp. M166]